MNYYKKTQFTHELTKEAKALTFPVETEVSAEEIENIIVSSLEGASTYWVGLDNTTPEWNDEPEDMPASQYATQLLLEGKTITLYDIEDEDERWELTLQMILKGIGAAVSRCYNITDDVDEILQLSLFGEVVYGLRRRNMEKFYFTYGTDSGYPFRGGWTLIIAPDIKAAARIFAAYHPNRDDSECLNCADYYRADYFEQSESYKTGNFGGYCHEIIGPYPAEAVLKEGGKT